MATSASAAGLTKGPSTEQAAVADEPDRGSAGQALQIEEAKARSDADAKDVDVKALEVLLDELGNEYSAEWQRKSAFETRAFALVTANLAVVTFLLALSDRNNVLQALRVGVPDELVTTGLVINGLSVLSALASAIPLRYRGIQAKGFTLVLDRINGPERLTQDKVVTQAIKAKARQLLSAKRANRFKAATGIVAFAAVAIASSLHTIAVFLVL